MQPYVIPFQSLGIANIPEVGGKNASLGEMIANLSSSGVQVPGGFATTAQAYRDFLANESLANSFNQREKDFVEATKKVVTLQKESEIASKKLNEVERCEPRTGWVFLTKLPNIFGYTDHFRLIYSLICV